MTPAWAEYSLQMPRFAISQITTLSSTFETDLRAYRDAGADGIGIWELKLADGRDDEALEQLAASGLGSGAAVPSTPSILPLPLMAGPRDPSARVDAICSSIHRLAPFRPTGIVCLTGPARERAPEHARETVIAGLQTIADEAEAAGVRVGLEPTNRLGGEDWTMVSSIPEAVALLDDVDRPTLGLQFDTWHLWNTDTLLDDVERESHRFVGVHVADWRQPTRAWADRVLPGHGAADLRAILGALDRAGWDGFYEVEIFSDNGSFGNAWPDSLWNLPPAELARQAKESFQQAWEARIREPVAQVSPRR